MIPDQAYPTIDLKTIRQISFSHFADYAVNVTDQLLKGIKRKVYLWSVVGEIRRCEEFVKVIEIVLVPKRSRLPDLKGYLNRKCSHVSFNRDDIWTMTFATFPVIIYVATKQNFVAMELLKTGPQSFVQKLIEHARKKGYQLKEDGFKKGDTLIVPEFESLIFEIISFPYLNPRERSNHENRLKEVS